MKVLVIYDSKYGNTEKAAKAISRVLEENSELDVDCKYLFDEELTRDKNVNRYNLDTLLHRGRIDLHDYDLVVVGGPTHAFGMSSNVKELFKKIGEERFDGKLGAAFDTKIGGFSRRFAGSAAKKIEGELRKRGFKIVIPYLNLYVKGSEGPLGDGEIDKCEQFAKKLIQNLKR